MQVYAWRQGGGELVRLPKRPFEPWRPDQLDHIPDSQGAARRIFDRLIELEAKLDAPAIYRIGVCTDLSPNIGIYRKDLAELTRRRQGDRVDITWIRGFWQSLHIVYGNRVLDRAKSLNTALIDRGKSYGRSLHPNKIWDIGRAGRGELHAPPYFVFVAIQIGGVGIGTEKVPFTARDRTEARDAEVGDRGGRGGRRGADAEAS